MFCSPKNIDLKSVNSFWGRIIHSNDFKKIEKKDLNNKHITIIGNGASCMDILKTIPNSTKNINVIYRKENGTYWIVYLVYILIYLLIDSHYYFGLAQYIYFYYY